MRGFAALLCCLAALAVSGCGSGSSSSSSAATSTTAAASTKKAEPKPAEASGEASGDHSIQEYGGAAAGSEKAAVSAAVHRFLTAMAAQDYAGMCAELAGTNREQLEAFSEGAGPGAAGCAAALKTLLNPAVATEARRAAAAPVTSVRIKGDSAFALFTPQGGSPSYLVMKREGNSWKSISVTPGAPLEPSASP